MNFLASLTRKTVHPKFDCKSQTQQGLGLGLGVDRSIQCVSSDSAQGTLALGLDNGAILIIYHPVIVAACSHYLSETTHTNYQQHSVSLEKLLVFVSKTTQTVPTLFQQQGPKMASIKHLSFKHGDKYLVAIDEKNQVMVWNMYSSTPCWERPLKLEANAEFIACHHVSIVSNWILFGMSNGDIVFVDLLKSNISRFYISYAQLIQGLPETAFPVSRRASNASVQRKSLDMNLIATLGQATDQGSKRTSMNAVNEQNTQDKDKPPSEQDTSPVRKSCSNPSLSLRTQRQSLSPERKEDLVPIQYPPLQPTDIPVSIKISPKDPNLILVAYQSGFMALYHLKTRQLKCRFSILPTDKVKNMLVRSTGKSFEEYTEDGEMLLGPITEAVFRYDGEQIVSSHGGYLVFWNVENVASSWVSDGLSSLKSTLVGTKTNTSVTPGASTGALAQNVASRRGSFDADFDRRPIAIRPVLSIIEDGKKSKKKEETTNATMAAPPPIHKLIWHRGYKSPDHTFLFVAGGVHVMQDEEKQDQDNPTHHRMSSTDSLNPTKLTDLTLLEFKGRDYQQAKRTYRIKNDGLSGSFHSVLDFTVIPHDFLLNTASTYVPLFPESSLIPSYPGFYLFILFSNGKVRFKDVPLEHSNSAPIPSTTCFLTESVLHESLPASLLMHSVLPPIKSAAFSTCSLITYSIFVSKLAKLATQYTQPAFPSILPQYAYDTTMIKKSFLDTSDIFVSSHADNKIYFWGKEKSKEYLSTLPCHWSCLYSIDLSCFVNITSLGSLLLDFYSFDDGDVGGHLIVCAGPHLIVFGFLGECKGQDRKSTGRPFNSLEGTSQPASQRTSTLEKPIVTPPSESTQEPAVADPQPAPEQQEEAVDMKGMDELENVDAMMSELDDVLVDVIQDTKNVKLLITKNAVVNEAFPPAKERPSIAKKTGPGHQPVYSKSVWNSMMGPVQSPLSKTINVDTDIPQDVVVEQLGSHVDLEGSGWYPMVQVVHLDLVCSGCFAPDLGIVASVTASRELLAVNVLTGKQILKDRLTDYRDIDPTSASFTQHESMVSHPLVFSHTYFDSDMITSCLLTLSTTGSLISYGIFTDEQGQISLRKELLYSPQNNHRPIFLQVLDSSFLPIRTLARKSSHDQHYIVVVLSGGIKLLSSTGGTKEKFTPDKIITRGTHTNGIWYELKTKFWKGAIYEKAQIVFFQDIPHLATITNKNILYIYSLPDLELLWEVDIPIVQGQFPKSPLSAEPEDEQGLVPNTLQTFLTLDGRLLSEISKSEYRSFSLSSTDSASVLAMEKKMYEVSKQSIWLRAHQLSLGQASYIEHDAIFKQAEESSAAETTAATSSSGRDNAFTENKRMLNERGEKLAEMSEKFGKLDNSAKSFLDQITAFNEKQTKKKWWQF